METELTTPSFFEAFVSTLFYKCLAGMHYLMISDKDVERLKYPNTTSGLYNFTRAF